MTAKRGSHSSISVASEPGYLAIKDHMLARPMGPLRKGAIVVALGMLDAVAADADGLELPDEPVAFIGVQLAVRRRGVLEFRGQRVALQGLPNLIQLRLDLQDRDRPDGDLKQGVNDARPPPAFEHFPRRGRLAPRRHHAKALLDLRPNVGHKWLSV
jgi:hypothetical protein